MTHLPTPDKEQIALLDTFDRLGLHQIQVVSTPEQAAAALKALAAATALGFDTESKPTFAKNEASDGPHIVQLSTWTKPGYSSSPTPNAAARWASCWSPRPSSRRVLAWVTTASASSQTRR